MLLKILFSHFFLQPFFQVDVELCVPSVTMNPNLDDVQSAIDQCALQIIKSTKDIAAWKLSIVFDSDERQAVKAVSSGVDTKFSTQNAAVKTIHSRVTNDIEMVKNVLILTGAVQTLRNRVCVIAFMLNSFCSCNSLPGCCISRHFHLLRGSMAQG